MEILVLHFTMVPTYLQDEMHVKLRPILSIEGEILAVKWNNETTEITQLR